MSKFVIRLLTLAMFAMAVVAAPLVTKAYAAPDNDAPPPSSTKSKAKKKTSDSQPSIEDAAFSSGYRAAYATIYDRHHELYIFPARGGTAQDALHGLRVFLAALEISLRRAGALRGG